MENKKGAEDMALKDWLLLFIPILFDGFLIWLFQYIVGKRIEQKITFRTLREEIFKTYLEKITQSISACHNLYTAKSEATVGDNESLNDLDIALQNLRTYIRELYYYFDTYKIVLSTNENVLATHNILKSRFEEWVLNWNNSEIQLSFIHDCEDILQSIMNEGLKYIYGIKK